MCLLAHSVKTDEALRQVKRCAINPILYCYVYQEC